MVEAKCFNIPHPTKENKRLVHAASEGPETAVYVRGRLTDNSVIELPDYWKGLVDPDSITVSLTQIGSSQDLIVEGVDWGNKVRVRSGNGFLELIVIITLQLGLTWHHWKWNRTLDRLDGMGL